MLQLGVTKIRTNIKRHKVHYFTKPSAIRYDVQPRWKYSATRPIREPISTTVCCQLVIKRLRGLYRIRVNDITYRLTPQCRIPSQIFVIENPIVLTTTPLCLCAIKEIKQIQHYLYIITYDQLTKVKHSLLFKSHIGSQIRTLLHEHSRIIMDWNERDI